MMEYRSGLYCESVWAPFRIGLGSIPGRSGLHFGSIRGRFKTLEGQFGASSVTLVALVGPLVPKSAGSYKVLLNLFRQQFVVGLLGVRFGVPVPNPSEPHAPPRAPGIPGEAGFPRAGHHGARGGELSPFPWAWNWCEDSSPAI